MLPITLGGYLVRGDRTVLIDAGLGPGRLMGLEGGVMLENLAALGVQPGDVTDVIFTHLHIDHIGWATQRGAITFPNATYRCSAADWQHFMVEHRDEPTTTRAPRGCRSTPTPCWSTPPAVRHLRRLRAPSCPGSTSSPRPATTPGSSVVVLSSGTARAMLLGDVVHCPAQLIETEWDGLMDVDPALAKRTREALARELEGCRRAGGRRPLPGHEASSAARCPPRGRRQWVVPRMA